LKLSKHAEQSFIYLIKAAVLKLIHRLIEGFPWKTV